MRKEAPAPPIVVQRVKAVAASCVRIDAIYPEVRRGGCIVSAFIATAFS